MVMLFNVFVFSMVATFASFISGYVLEKYAGFALADWLFTVGTLFLLATYASLLLALAFSGMKGIAGGLKSYFSRNEASKRKVLYIQSRLLDRERLHRMELLQIHYHMDRRRERLYRRNTKKHLRALMRSIAAALNSRQRQIPALHYRSFRKALQRNYQAENIEALLKLQLKIQSFR